MTKLRMEETETENPLFQAAGSHPGFELRPEVHGRRSHSAGDYVAIHGGAQRQQFPPYIYGDSEFR